MGTSCFSVSMSVRQASNASPRCGQDTATTTARSPTARSPTRCTAASASTPNSAATFSATRRSSASAEGCALYERRTTPCPPSWSRTVPTNKAIAPAPGSLTAARTSSTDSGSSRISASLITFTPATVPGSELRGFPASYDQALLCASLAAARGADDRGGADHGHGGAGCRDGRFLPGQTAAGRAMAGPGLHQRLEHRGVVVRGAPARLAQRLAVDHPRVNQVLQIVHRGGGDAHPVQPLRGAERQPRGQFDPAQPADPLHLFLLQPPVTPHGKGAGHVANHGQFQGRDQIVAMTELPSGRGALDGEQAGRI